DQPEVLEPRPIAIVALAGHDLRAARAAVLRRTPRIERQDRPVVRTEASVAREESLGVGPGQQPREQRGRALAKGGVQRGKVGRAGDLLAARDDFLCRHHARTPSDAQRTGSPSAPAVRAAADASAESSFMMKNIEPPAPDPAALPPTDPAPRT